MCLYTQRKHSLIVILCTYFHVNATESTYNVYVFRNKQNEKSFEHEENPFNIDSVLRIEHMHIHFTRNGSLVLFVCFYDKNIQKSPFPNAHIIQYTQHNSSDISVHRILQIESFYF